MNSSFMTSRSACFKCTLAFICASVFVQSMSLPYGAMDLSMVVAFAVSKLTGSMKQRIICLAQGHNTVPPVRLLREPATHWALKNCH